MYIHTGKALTFKQQKHQQESHRNGASRRITSLPKLSNIPMLNGRWWPQQLRAQQFVSMVERRECVKDSVKHGEIASATANR